MNTWHEPRSVAQRNGDLLDGMLLTINEVLFKVAHVQHRTLPSVGMLVGGVNLDIKLPGSLRGTEETVNGWLCRNSLVGSLPLHSWWSLLCHRLPLRLVLLLLLTGQPVAPTCCSDSEHGESPDCGQRFEILFEPELVTPRA